MSCAKTAEPKEMPFGIIVSGPRQRMYQLRCTLATLANTSEPPVCGGDAVLSNNFDHFFLSAVP